MMYFIANGQSLETRQADFANRWPPPGPTSPTHQPPRPANPDAGGPGRPAAFPGAAGHDVASQGGGPAANAGELR